MDAYRETLRLAAGSLRARLNLAEALQREGRTDEAERELALARRLYPSSRSVRALEARLDE